MSCLLSQRFLNIYQTQDGRLTPKLLHLSAKSYANIAEALSDIYCDKTEKGNTRWQAGNLLQKMEVWIHVHASPLDTLARHHKFHWAHGQIFTAHNYSFHLTMLLLSHITCFGKVTINCWTWTCVLFYIFYGSVHLGFTLFYIEITAINHTFGSQLDSHVARIQSDCICLYIQYSWQNRALF